MRVIARNGGDVVAKPAKVVNQPEIGALIERNFIGAWYQTAFPLGGFGETSSPVAIALA